MKFSPTVLNTILELSTREMKITKEMRKRVRIKTTIKINKKTQRRRRNLSLRKNQIQRVKIKKMELQQKNLNAKINDMYV